MSVVPLLDHLRLILEHSHNRYGFEYRCKGLKSLSKKDGTKASWPIIPMNEMEASDSEDQRTLNFCNTNLIFP